MLSDGTRWRVRVHLPGLVERAKGIEPSLRAWEARDGRPLPSGPIRSSIADLRISGFSVRTHPHASAPAVSKPLAGLPALVRGRSVAVPPRKRGRTRPHHAAPSHAGISMAMQPTPSEARTSLGMASARPWCSARSPAQEGADLGETLHGEGDQPDLAQQPPQPRTPQHPQGRSIGQGLGIVRVCRDSWVAGGSAETK